MNAAGVIIYVILVILVIWLIFCVAVADNSMVITIVRVLLILWLIWLLFAPWVWTNRDRDRDCGNKYVPKIVWATTVDSTFKCPENTKLTLCKICPESDSVFSIKLDGNEVKEVKADCNDSSSNPSNEDTFTPVSEGYSKTFNVVIPHFTSESVPDVDTLVEWTSDNGTVLTVKYVGSFENVVVTVIPKEGVRFLGDLKFNVINNGLITKMKGNKTTLHGRQSEWW